VMSTPHFTIDALLMKSILGKSFLM
jgi:hypothetical protein